jgi:hypothetical protein
MENWDRAKAVLQANPWMMTPRILQLTLRQQPPLHVVEFMLSLNPQVAAIPKRGPTALQCAVRYGVAIDVIVCLLKACPFALLTSNLDDTGFKDPLECAQKTRADEYDLIEILSQPLSYWLRESYQSKRLAVKDRDIPVAPLVVPKEKPTSTLDSSDRQEMENIKVITAAIVKSQKRQMYALEVHRQEVRMAERSKTKALGEMEQRQRNRVKMQLMALDYKETLLRYKTRNMELVAAAKNFQGDANRTNSNDVEQERTDIEVRKEAALLKLEESAETFDRMVKEWKSKTERRIRKLECKFKQECTMNEFHRKDTRLQLDHVEESVLQARSFEPWILAAPVFAASAIADGGSNEPLLRTHPIQRASSKGYFWHSSSGMKTRIFERMVSK